MEPELAQPQYPQPPDERGRYFRDLIDSLPEDYRRLSAPLDEVDEDSEYVPVELRQSKFPRGDEKKYEISRIWDRHREIIRLIVLGYWNREIADMVGCTSQTVCNIRNSEIVQAKLRELHNVADRNACDIGERLQKLAPLAVDTLEETLASSEASRALKAKVATEVLDRTGHKPPTRVEGEIFHGILTSEHIEAIKQRARQANIVVDVASSESSQLPSSGGSSSPLPVPCLPSPTVEES